MIEDQTARIEIRSLPDDRRVRVVIHEIVPEDGSFITSKGLISFIPDGPEELEKIDQVDALVSQNRERIMEAPPMMHVRAGHSLLAFYQDTFYRGLCLRAYAKDAEIWFAEFGNVAKVPKTDLRSIPKEFLAMPSVSLLGRLNVTQRQSSEGDLQSWILEDFNRKVSLFDDRKADVVCRGVSRSPFKTYLIDLVFGGDDSSFLTLLSNKPNLDWGLSFEVSPLKIELKTPNVVGPGTSSYEVGSRERTPRPRPLMSSTTSPPAAGTTSLPAAGTTSPPAAGTTLPPAAGTDETPSKYPLSIEGCHRRIEELEIRVNALEEKMKKLCPA